MDLSIIIVSYKSCQLLLQCLESLARTSESRALEIVVVDNASMDGTLEAVRKQFPAVRVIANERNVGFAVANNQGIKSTVGKYVLLLNPDTAVREGALRAMRDFLEQHPEAGAVGCKLLNPDGTVQASAGRFPNLFMSFCHFSFLQRLFPNLNLTGKYLVWHYDHTQEVDHLLGACLFTRREALEQAGGMDEGYFLFIEETDLCYRLKQRGWKIYFVPDGEVIHYGGQSTQQHYVESLTQGHRSLYRFYRKNYGVWHERALKAMTLGGFALRMAILRTALLVRRASPQAERQMQLYRQVIAETKLVGHPSNE